MSIYTFQLSAGAKTVQLTLDIGWITSSWSSGPNFFLAHTGSVATKTGAIELIGMAGPVGILSAIPASGLDSVPIGATGTLKVLLGPMSGDYTPADGTWELTGK